MGPQEKVATLSKLLGWANTDEGIEARVEWHSKGNGSVVTAEDIMALLPGDIKLDMLHEVYGLCEITFDSSQRKNNKLTTQQNYNLDIVQS